ncbi:MAG: hydrolase, partial [Bacteroides sp.]|nr:hydrolase [Bacteroides sp.]
MNSINSNRRFSYKDLLYKCLIFIVTVGIITYFMPKEGKFNYEFELKTPWKYGLLQAPFDVRIYKSDQQIEREQDSLRAFYQPYFLLEKDTEKNMLAKFREDYNRNMKFTLPSSDYLRHIERTLKHIYEKGILSAQDAQLLLEDSITHVQIVNGNMATSQKADHLFTVKGAYEYILNADTAHYNKRILQSCNLSNYLTSNITYDLEKSESILQDLQSSIAPVKGLVLTGQKIIDRGEIIDEHTYDILRSLEKEWEKRSESIQEIRLTYMGQAILVSVLIICFMIYLELFRKEYYERKRSVLLLFALIVFFPLLLSIMVEQNLSNVYVVPLAVIPIIIGIFLDSRTAFMAHTTIILLCSIFLRYPHEFIILQIAAGMTAIYSLRELSQRSQLLRTALIVVICYALLHFAFELMQEND